MMYACFASIYDYRETQMEMGIGYIYIWVLKITLYISEHVVDSLDQ